MARNSDLFTEFREKPQDGGGVFSFSPIVSWVARWIKVNEATRRLGEELQG